MTQVVALDVLDAVAYGCVVEAEAFVVTRGPDGAVENREAVAGGVFGATHDVADRSCVGPMTMWACQVPIVRA